MNEKRKNKKIIKKTKNKKPTRPCNLFLTSHPGLTPELCLAGRHHRGSCDNPGPALPSWSRCVGRKDVAVGTGDLQDKKKRMKENYFGLEVHTHWTANPPDTVDAVFHSSAFQQYKRGCVGKPKCWSTQKQSSHLGLSTCQSFSGAQGHSKCHSHLLGSKRQMSQSNGNSKQRDPEWTISLELNRQRTGRWPPLCHTTCL